MDPSILRCLNGAYELSAKTRLKAFEDLALFSNNRCFEIVVFVFRCFLYSAVKKMEIAAKQAIVNPIFDLLLAFHFRFLFPFLFCFCFLCFSKHSHSIARFGLCGPEGAYKAQLTVGSGPEAPHLQATSK